MQVLAMCGPNCAGKTTLLASIAHLYPTVDERYIQLNDPPVDNRTILSKWRYIGDWFNRILTLRQQGAALAITDRSPLDTVAYATDGPRLLLPIILRSLEEAATYQVDITPVLITADVAVLAERLSKRLTHQPHRANYHEGRPDFFTPVIDFYQQHSHLWKHTIDTTDIDLEQAKELVLCLARDILRNDQRPTAAP